MNGTFAGEESEIERLEIAINQFHDAISPEPIFWKRSPAKIQPFGQFNIQIRSEIVNFEKPDFHPPENRSALSPRQWHEKMQQAWDPESKKKRVILDTRNKYETEIGKFIGAVDPEIQTFNDLKTFFDSWDVTPDTEVMMYCTGGVRCEKALVDLKDRGFQEVYQLDGGILNYLEQYPNGYYQGECFVFDRRVAVDANLHPSTRYQFCVHCGQTAEEDVQCSQCKNSGYICKTCQQNGKKTCSKNCEYHATKHLKPDTKRQDEAKKQGDQSFSSRSDRPES
jgi:UPF0176 protein